MQSSYEFVPDLLNNENIYSNKLKERVKVDEIFNEINNSANSTLKKFIQMSHTRYKRIKGGIPINNFLNKQKEEYEELSNKILENTLYQTNDVQNEVKKLYKKVGTKERRELNRIRKSIIDSSKNLTQSEINLRKQYEDKINKSKQNKDEEIKKKNKEIKMLENFFSNEKNMSIEDKKNYLTNILDMDSQYFNKNFENYKNFLKDIEKIKDNAKIVKIMNKNDDLGHKHNFKINNIKFLSFKDNVKENVIKKIKTEEKFDFKKLAQYTKHGNKKWFEKQLKEQSIKRMNSVKSNLKNKNHGFLRSISQNNSNSCTNFFPNKTYKSATINNSNISYNNNTIYDSSNNTGFNKTIFGNFRNTIQTVRSEAEFIKNINQNFDIKRNTVNKFIKNNYLPNIEDYEKFGRQSIINESDKSNINKPKSKLEETNEDNIYEFNFVKTKKENDENDIMDIYKSTFYNKMQGWTKEQKIKSQKKKMDNIRKEISRKYINELKNRKRQPNLFVDVYSLRDGVINEKIKLLNNSLNMPIYSEKLRLDIINDFNTYIQQKEKERLLNEEIMKKKQIEEEELIKAQDDYYQVMQKMRNNLKLESGINNEESKINFNYKYCPNIKNNRKENKSESKEAFDEYLISLHNAKIKSSQNKDYSNNEVEDS